MTISIHALLAESDVTSEVSDRVPLAISIHALLAESDNILCVVSVQVGGFLSTLSLRRATTMPSIRHISQTHFYPRSPCGERPVLGIQHRVGEYISIHALLAESDGISLTHIIGFLAFLSTLSLRRATDTSSLLKCQVKFLSTLSLRRATQ